MTFYVHVLRKMVVKQLSWSVNMNAEQDQMAESENKAADLEARLNQAMQALLAPMALRQVTAREAYGAMIRVVARIEGDVPTGARLVGLLQLFNAQRPAGVPPIPAGTAGVAQDCVAAYRRTLVRASSAGVANAALPPDMVEGLNRWLERLLGLMRDEIKRPYEAQAVELRASLDQEMAILRSACAAELAAANEAGKVQAMEIQQGLQQRQELQRQIESQLQRLTELEVALNRTMQENHELATRLAVQQTLQEESARQLAQAADAMRSAQVAGDEERRQRLLALDAARVVEQELAREKEKRRAAETQARELQKYLEQEKERSVQLQSVLAEVQRRPDAAPALAERPTAQNRIKPARRTAAPAAPMRRKSLR
jgi:hypothetical protein